MTDSRELRKAGPGGAGLLKKVQFSSPLGEAGAWGLRDETQDAGLEESEAASLLSIGRDLGAGK